MLRKVLATAAMAVMTVSAAQAQTIIYDNTATASFSGSLYTNKGATAANPVTNFVADDINFAVGSAGLKVSSFKFSIFTTSTTGFAATPHVRFFADNPTTGDPTTYLGGVDFAPITFTAGGGSIYTFNSTSPLFTIPADNFVWAGITFDGSTFTNLNTLGQGLFSTPTIGTSDDVFLRTTVPGLYTSSFPASPPTPAGVVYSYFGGSPLANFGWQFSVAPAVVPEPSQYAALGLGVLGLGILGLKARRRGVNAA